MKKIVALTLVIALLMCGCGGQETPEQKLQEMEAPAAAETTAAAEAAEPASEPTTEPATEPTTVPTEPPKVYFDPLNGEILDAPFSGRIYATTVSNTNDGSVPHVGAIKADVIMEMYVNGSVVRLLALFSDLSDVEAIGSTRSTRLMFNDIAQHYNAILTHAGGSSQCLSDANSRGIAHFNIDSLMRQGDPLSQGTAYRDKDHPKQKYGEYNLYGIGPGIMAYAESQDVMISGMPEVDYGLVFTEDGTPADGEAAQEITVTLSYGQSRKDTTMIYDEALGKYVFHQYGKMMQDLMTEEPESFENVIVMHTNITSDGIYQTADFVAGGTGYFACGGKIIPITWTCEGEDSPFRYWTEDGEPLLLGMGSSYIAVCTPESAVVW